MVLCRRRIQKYKGRVRRAKHIFGTQRYSTIFRCGILPGLAYGCELVDYGDDVIRHTDSACKQALQLAVPFVPDAVLWAWLGPTARPSFSLMAESLVRYARAVWAVSEHQLAEQTGLARATVTKLTMHELVIFSRVIRDEAYGHGTLCIHPGPQPQGFWTLP
jgi:hypothetical protein